MGIDKDNGSLRMWALGLAAATMVVAGAGPVAGDHECLVGGCPIGWWAFDDGEGNVASDGSGNGNDGTIHGAQWTTGGAVGGALVFDGFNDYVHVPDDATMDHATMTVMAWVKPTTLTTDESAVMARNDYSNVQGWGLWVDHPNNPNQDAFLFHYSRPGINVEVDGVTAAPSGVWTHVAVTYDGAAFKLYVNGVRETTTSWGEGIGQSHDDDILIGTTNGGALDGNPYFRGNIDEVKFFGKALSGGEVLCEYLLNVHPCH